MTPILNPKQSVGKYYRDKDRNMWALCRDGTYKLIFGIKPEGYYSFDLKDLTEVEPLK